MTSQPKPANEPPEYLSIAEAAARYHVSRDYIRDRIIDGSLPAVRSGRKIIRVNSRDLERLFRPVQSLRSLGSPAAAGEAARLS
ncbi:MAG: excisionase family DNA-binding protein [Propionibacteriaceae bacterium]|nr:excisionase family DNA-binding protein [Propionibacteriaceae bacterium]